MRVANVAIWLILPLLLLAAGPARAQDAAAKQLRKQAFELRSDAGKLRDQAAQARAAAGQQRQTAQDARQKGAEARTKGDNSAAETFEKQARDAASQAQELDGTADDLERKAAGKEELATDKESEARKLESASKSAADQLYRRIREVASKASEDLADLKQFQRATRVGRESMSVRWLHDNVHDEELKPFGEKELNALFAPYEQQIDALSRGVEQERNALAADKATPETYAGSTYDLIKEFAIQLEPAMFRIVAAGYDTIEAQLYKLERQLNEELRSAQEQLRNANIPEDAKVAFLNALKARQSEDRRKLFMVVGPQYRAAKNHLALYVLDWVELLKGCHDLAASLSSGDDVHRGGANTMDGALRYFSADYVALPMSLAVFMNTPGSIDRFNLQLDSYDWCKARPFPDIQAEDDPGQFRMFGILDKLPLLTRGGKVDGAARTINP